ncbi:MAG TPA: NAD(P)-binding domain-containing protein [Jatrophihabitans sp.]|nr:NAD(P)-binding domain-containing protein [Jatrophihabitans sp.]
MTDPVGTPPRIGFVGLGAMGAPMAERLRGGGHQVSLWARRPQTLERFPEPGYSRAKTLEDLGAASDVVCVCVVGDADVREVVAGPSGLLSGSAPDTAILVHSTVAARTCRELAETASGRGVAVLDAPVSGGPGAAAAGTLAVMVGGDRAVFDRLRPVLGLLGRVVRYMGPVGAGEAMKVLNNALAFANGRLASIAVENAVRLGLELGAAIDVLGAGSARSSALDVIVHQYLPDPSWGERTKYITAKDTELYAGLVEAAGLGADELLRLARQRVEFAGPRLGRLSADTD